jgi:acyl dehydratase
MPWFDDMAIGTYEVLGSYTFSQAEIIRFAAKFDPQYFHIDPAAAAAGPFGGLVASGWHTISVWMKLRVASLRARAAAAEADGPAAGPSPGFLDLKWPNPVRPGDTIQFDTRLTEKIELRTRPDWGLIRGRNEGVNQRGETVLSFTGQALIRRKPPAA